MTAKFHFINHACFIVEKNNSAIIFDPYLEGNPEGLTAKDIKVDYIFVSHGHFDHLGSAFEIAKNINNKFFGINSYIFFSISKTLALSLTNPNLLLTLVT